MEMPNKFTESDRMVPSKDMFKQLILLITFTIIPLVVTIILLRSYDDFRDRKAFAEAPEPYTTTGPFHLQENHARNMNKAMIVFLLGLA
jgi:hypothetical protein